MFNSKLVKQTKICHVVHEITQEQACDNINVLKLPQNHIDSCAKHVFLMLIYRLFTDKII